MGNSLPDISIEWDDAHAKALGPELSIYRRIVNRLGSREGVETSFGDEDQGTGTPWPQVDVATANSGATVPPCAQQDEGAVGDIREMRRSLNRLRELGARITINGHLADSVALDRYEDALCREVRELELRNEEGPDASGGCFGLGGGGCLSSIITFVGLVVVLRWLFS
ncbi:hypothetical protein AXK11_06095 [Cephaloticoccus primus]|uniref:Uncharacterized protein n=1 Tax=Cephaloticoccus primus TaxID=1548207 RepID=A0A139SLX6_9BACT|nr:hypothetical protein [Cephaloticoccus primus]KXU35556.1 hypothetical protein AXK11_06095 [Cephaloticoccus primus]